MKEGKDISNYPVTIMTHAELPKDVKIILDNNIDNVIASDSIFYFSNSEKKFKHYRKSIQDKSWLYEVNNNDDYFKVEDKIYRSNTVKGDPFIYDSGYIYYCEYNMYKDEYKDQKYYRILLK